jgi:hypothetical protein
MGVGSFGSDEMKFLGGESLPGFSGGKTARRRVTGIYP